MAIAHFNHFNNPLEKEVGFSAILPDRQDSAGPYPVYYLLHGLSDDYTAWLRWTSIERYVRSLPLIVVMPDGDRCWYSDIPDGPAYERALLEGLIPFVDRFLPSVAAREGRVIGGLSMGGYGAMKLALKRPDLFCAVAAHSGAYKAREHARHQVAAEDCPFALASRLALEQAPAIRFDCGRQDVLVEHSRALHAHLDALGIAHEYAEYSGGHDWAYWDEHVQEAIAFLCSALGIR